MHSSAEIFDDIDQLGDKFAETLAVRVKECAGRRFFLALSGGRTPESLMHRLTLPGLRDAAPWEKVELFFTDERPVGPDHPDSNYGMVQRAWLDSGAVPEGQVHRMQGEAGSLAAEAERYEDLITRIVPPGPTSFPAFDLIVLGIGDDGHVASLFPGTKALDETMRVTTVNHVPKLGLDRLTITFPVINAAREIWMIVCGESKSAAVARALSGPPQSLIEPLPVSLVHPAYGKMKWWLDRAAASKWKAESRTA
ncbi:6-phosphogluconolactonase [bacterium]|nr:6-phosphogluconolactonase [bacterium]